MAMLWNMHLGACVFIIAASLPSPWLWWAPKKTDEKIMEQLVEMEQWVKANLDVLRSREGGCFNAKLRTWNGDEEKRFHNMMTRDKKRLEANAALAEQIAKLDCMVMATGSTSLQASVSSATAEGGPARGSTDAALSTQEPRKKRTNRGDRKGKQCRQGR